jgi:hypothetical protein
MHTQPPQSSQRFHDSLYLVSCIFPYLYKSAPAAALQVTSFTYTIHETAEHCP